jgi:ActR/RegA family two-component response regulator
VSNSHPPTLEQVNRKYMRFVLFMAGGNKSAAAKLLDIHRRTLLTTLRGS